MNYPHVAGLRYRFIPEEWARFFDPAPVERHTPSFYLRLDGDLVTVWMKEHHCAGDSARKKVEDYLRRWEVLSALQHNGRRLMHFECKRVEVLDLEDPFSCKRTSPLEVSFEARWAYMRSHDQYPALPDDFDFTADVEVMWTLYDRYIEGRERLLTMAYTCLTWLQYRVAGNNEKVAQEYNVNQEVLDHLGKLSSTLGAGAEARKKKRSESQGRDPTPKERLWLEATVRILIKRAGEYAADPKRAWPEITKRLRQ
jgi:hypothetical protein